MTINGKNGTLIERFSDKKHEKEILFQRGSTFKIESLKVKEKPGIMGIIQMVLVEI